MLYIVATPIGNLKDITLRAIETLSKVDAIICEDTRHSSILLNHYQIKKPLISLNDYNESKKLPEILNALQEGKNMALISDAGTPLVSDPGYKLVRECKNLNIEIDSIPGAVAAITALTLSALPPDKFSFIGFLPEKPGHRQDMYKKIQQTSEILPTTFIIYIAPFKLVRILEEMQEVFNDPEITLAMELTKIHQSVASKNASSWLTEFNKKAPKGEITLLIRI